MAGKSGLDEQSISDLDTRETLGSLCSAHIHTRKETTFTCHSCVTIDTPASPVTPLHTTPATQFQQVHLIHTGSKLLASAPASSRLATIAVSPTCTAMWMARLPSLQASFTLALACERAVTEGGYTEGGYREQLHSRYEFQTAVHPPPLTPSARTCSSMSTMAGLAAEVATCSAVSPVTALASRSWGEGEWERGDGDACPWEG